MSTPELPKVVLRYTHQFASIGGKTFCVTCRAPFSAEVPEECVSLEDQLAALRADVERLKRQRADGYCLECGSMPDYCRKIWAEQRKCCPDCTHGAALAPAQPLQSVISKPLSRAEYLEKTARLNSPIDPEDYPAQPPKQEEWKPAVDLGGGHIADPWTGEVYLFDGKAPAEPSAVEAKTGSEVTASWDRLRAKVKEQTGDDLGAVTFIRCDSCDAVLPAKDIGHHSPSGINRCKEACRPAPNIAKEPEARPEAYDIANRLALENSELTRRLEGLDKETVRQETWRSNLSAELKVRTKELAAAEARVKELDAELLSICEATGYVNRAEGQGGYERITGQELAKKWREHTDRTELAESRITKALEALRATGIDVKTAPIVAILEGKP